MPDGINDLVNIEVVEAGPNINDLLPFASVPELTELESTRHNQFMAALVQIGQAAGGALVCPGNQEGVSEVNKCPYAAKCELLKAHKAPSGQLCPIEREIIVARFYGWCLTIGADPKVLREDQRAVVSELVWIDVQEQRCTNILSRGEASRLSQMNVKDSNPETDQWISWERVLHVNAVLLESLHTRRRMIMKEWMMTPEQKFKAAKALGKLNQGDDLGRKLSSRADKLRDLQIIEGDYEENPK